MDLLQMLLFNTHPRISQVDLPSFRSDVGKCVQNMGELLRWDVLRLMIPAIDCPIDEVSHTAISWVLCHGVSGLESVLCLSSMSM